MFGFDKQFLYKLIEKNEETFEEFYNTSIDIFFRYIKSNYRFQDSQVHDILSEFYVKLWNNLERLDVENNFSSYVWTMFKNNIIDYIKEKKTLTFTELSTEEIDFESNIEDEHYDIVDITETNFTSDKIKEALEKLDENFKDVIFMKYILSYDNNKISEELNISEDNVRQRIHRGLSKLKKLLDHLGYEG